MTFPPLLNDFVYTPYGIREKSLVLSLILLEKMPDHYNVTPYLK